MAKRNKAGMVGLGLYQNIKQLHAQNPTLTMREIGRVVNINPNYVSYALHSSSINQFIEKVERHRKRIADYTEKRRAQKKEINKIDDYHNTKYNKITDVSFTRIKDRISLGHTAEDMGISMTTYHRIKRCNTMKEYQDLIRQHCPYRPRPYRTEAPKTKPQQTRVVEVAPKTKTVKAWGWGYKTIKIPMFKRHSYKVVEE